MSNYICPICNAEYEEKTTTCSCCGFDGIEYVDYFNEESYKEYEKKSLFKIYKFAKKVALGEIDYPISKYDTQIYENTIIESIWDKRTLAYVTAPDMTLCDGVLAFQTNIRALIVDVKGIDCEFLNESNVQMLFFGKHVRYFAKGRSKGFFISFSALRYIWVDSENPYFYADNNVLFNKDQTKLICYARMRPEEEYTVPRSVEKIQNYAFFFPKHLKKLYIHKGTQIDDYSFKFYDDAAPEIIYID